MNLKKRLNALEQRTNILTFEKDGEIGFLGKGLAVSYDGFVKLKEENENLKNQIKEIKQYIPKVGEPSNYISIDAYEKTKNQLESARMTISKISSSLDHVILGEGLLKFVKKHADNWLKENPRGEK